MEPEQHVDLRTYLAVLRRRIWTIVVSTVVITGAATASVLLATPVYVATAEVAVEPPGARADTALLGQVFLGAQEIETQLRIVTSSEVAQIATDLLGLQLSPAALQARVGASRIGDTRVILLSARDPDAERAATIANAVGEAYLDHRRAEALERLVAASSDVEVQIVTIRDRLAEIEARLAEADGEDEGDDADRGLEGERRILEERIGILTAQLTNLEATDSFVLGGGEIIRSATAPASPAEPQPGRTVALGLVAGLVLGVGLAFLRDRLDDAIRTEDDAVAATGGRPVLALIPWAEVDDTRPAMLVTPSGALAEAIRTLRSNLRFLSGRDPFRSILVTSALEGEGKTTVAANLAVAAAGAGHTVVVVDADLRRPAVHRVFGTPNGVGVSHLLTGQHDLADALTRIDVAGLEILPAGRVPPNPAELLGSQALADLIRDLIDLFDLVVIDAPPVLPVADVLEASQVADATLLVVDAGASGRRAVRDAASRLDRIGAHFVGTALNRIDPADMGYGYYTYAEPAEPRTARGRRRTERDAVRSSGRSSTGGDD